MDGFKLTSLLCDPHTTFSFNDLMPAIIWSIQHVWGAPEVVSRYKSRTIVTEQDA